MSRYQARSHLGYDEHRGEMANGKIARYRRDPQDSQR